MFTITFAGKPHTMQRPRVTKRGTYYKQDMKQAMKTVQEQLMFAVQLQQHKEITGACKVTITAVYKRPVRLGKGNRIIKSTSPDADNIAKFYLDCLNRVNGFWTDDRLCADLRVTKWYCADYESPYCTLTVESI
jgi:Holliday junction resolvase RusA-like endonuclease